MVAVIGLLLLVIITTLVALLVWRQEQDRVEAGHEIHLATLQTLAAMRAATREALQSRGL